MGSLKATLCAHDQFAKLSGCPLASRGQSYAVGVFANETVSAGNRHAQAHSANHWEVGKISTQLCHLRILQIQLAE